jgi:hypothetical protein
MTRLLAPPRLLALAAPASAQCCGSGEPAQETQGLVGNLAPEPEQAAEPSLALDDVKAVFADLIATAYPELSAVKYKLYTFKAKTIRFRSNISVRSLFFGKRVYRLGVNESVLTDPPPPNALRAVLAHELAHTLYYHRRTRPQLWGTAKIFFNRDAQIDFERATDLEACARGFAPGLAEYREWIEARMPDGEKKYGQTYYDVDELNELECIRQEQPELLQTWQADPPRSLKAILERRAR